MEQPMVMICYTLFSFVQMFQLVHGAPKPNNRIISPWHKQSGLTLSSHERFSHPRVQISAPPSVQLGTTVSIECESFAAPSTRIEWTFNGKNVFDVNADWNYLSEAYELEEELNQNAGVVTYQLTDYKSMIEIPCFDVTNVGVYSCTGYSPSAVSAPINFSLALAQDNQLSSDLDQISCLYQKTLNPEKYRPKVTAWVTARLENQHASVVLPCRSSSVADSAKTWTRELLNGNQVPVLTSEEYSVLENGDLLVKPSVDCSMGGCMFVCTVDGKRLESFLYEVVADTSA